VDLNRVPELEMDRFVSQFPAEASDSWSAVKLRYAA
jgi:hypothetical protein